MAVKTEQDIDFWFEKEVKPCDQRLRAYLNQKESEPADVDDIVQESYRQMIETKQKRDIHSPEGLLFTIARNVSNGRLRKKYKENTFSVGDFESFDNHVTRGDAFDSLDREDVVELLNSAISSLPKKCRKIVVLRMYHKLSYKQIASRLGISVSTVENQISRGIKRCKKHFSKNGFSF